MLTVRAPFLCAPDENGTLWLTGLVDPDDLTVLMQQPVRPERSPRLMLLTFAAAFDLPCSDLKVFQAVRRVYVAGVREELAGVIAHELAHIKNRDTLTMTIAATIAGARILLVEDDPTNQEVARELLQAVGLVVEVADDGEAAVAMASRNRYDLILMDMQMPRMNGLEAAQAIRADALNRDTPILATTANAFDEDAAQSMAAGMDAHLAKPYSRNQLRELLQRWL